MATPRNASCAIGEDNRGDTHEPELVGLELDIGPG
jgi:hypothetical protein